MTTVVSNVFPKRYGAGSVAYKTQADGDVTFTSGNPPIDLLAWDDLSFPATGINPTGATDAPTVDIDVNSFTGTLLFSGTVDNILALSIQMPHSWAKGTAIKPHIHWQLPVGSANAVGWQLYYRHFGAPGVAAGAWSAAIPGVLTVGDQTITEGQVITSFGSIDMTGKIESALTLFKLIRTGSTDANSGTARLIQFDVHYQKDKFGTYTEIPS